MISDSVHSGTRVVYRDMTNADIPAVAEMEKAVFSDPWPRSAFIDVVTAAGWGGLVAEIDGVIIGYACYLVVDVEAHLTNIAVAPEHRRKSVARHLLSRILSIADGRGCEFILLEVRPSNHEALAFYRKYGFKVLYQRPNYYRRPVEDAIVMVHYFDRDDTAT
ncbi:MAG: ribosomal protein S18-alanine N-acetyltransferase [candidate division Zixibacteria bacterium]|nr:ribosomal protein S18-alanine N-acetyltransferase [candidate division Zixibacteria bacterium]